MNAVGQVLMMYALAIVISMVVAVLIRGVVKTLKARDTAPKQASATRPNAPVGTGIPGEHLAAITAAVYSVMGAHRILHLQESGRKVAWTVGGRALHHASHNIDRHRRR